MPLLVPVKALEESTFLMAQEVESQTRNLWDMQLLGLDQEQLYRVVVAEATVFEGCEKFQSSIWQFRFQAKRLVLMKDLLGVLQAPPDSSNSEPIMIPLPGAREVPEDVEQLERP